MSDKIQEAIDYLENFGPIYAESSGMSDWKADAALDTLLSAFERFRKQRDDLLAACEAVFACPYYLGEMASVLEAAIAKAKGENK